MPDDARKISDRQLAELLRRIHTQHTARLEQTPPDNLGPGLALLELALTELAERRQAEREQKGRA